jgi:hypothetical protein
VSELNIPLDDLAMPINTALSTYEMLSREWVSFDKNAAAVLELTPGGFYSAQSVSDVRGINGRVGTLTVAVLAPDDGRKKAPIPVESVHSEAHLTLLSIGKYATDTWPVLYAGSLAATLGDRNGRVIRRATIGQPDADFAATMDSGTRPKPRVTFVTGYQDVTELHDSLGDRYGDPRKLHNNTGYIQVCGFLALATDPPEEALHRFGQIFRPLGAKHPIWERG